METSFGYRFHPAVQEILHVHEQSAESADGAGRVGGPAAQRRARASSSVSVKRTLTID